MCINNKEQERNIYFQEIGKLSVTQSRFDFFILTLISTLSNVPTRYLTNIFITNNPTTGRLIHIATNLIKEKFEKDSEIYEKYIDLLNNAQILYGQRNEILHSMINFNMETEKDLLGQMINFKKIPFSFKTISIDEIKSVSSGFQTLINFLALDLAKLLPLTKNNT